MRSSDFVYALLLMVLGYLVVNIVLTKDDAPPKLVPLCAETCEKG